MESTTTEHVPDAGNMIEALKAANIVSDSPIWKAIGIWFRNKRGRGFGVAGAATGIDLEIERLIDRAASISRASQGSGVGMEESFQARVAPWMLACFGAEISGDLIERGDRLLEEVLELLQSGGYDPARVASLRDYVYGRPIGEPAQEAGGVEVTMAAYCLAAGIDKHASGETELARIWTKVEKIRAKQAAKPKHSPLPVALSPPATPQASEDVRAKAVAVIDDARSYAFGFPSSEYVAGALDRAHLLATPVTVTMEDIKTILGEFGIECCSTFAWDFGQVMAHTLGDRIQIAASEGPK